MEEATFQCQSCRNTLTITGLEGVGQAAHPARHDARDARQQLRQGTPQSSGQPSASERQQAGLSSLAASRMDESFIVLDRSGRCQHGAAEAQPAGVQTMYVPSLSTAMPHASAAVYPVVIEEVTQADRNRSRDTDDTSLRTECMTPA